MIEAAEIAGDRLTIQRVYSLPMGKITIHLKGHKESVVLSGKKVEENEDKDQLLIYDHQNKVIGKFVKAEVAGWSVDRD